MFSEAEQSGALTGGRPSVGLRRALSDTALMNTHLTGPTHLFVFFFFFFLFLFCFFFNTYLFSSFLAAPGLSCGMRDFWSSLQQVGSLVVVCEMLVALCGI